MPDGSDYSARHLSVLDGLEAVRKRPGMYIGSTDGRGLTHCLWEIFDNAVDEALAGFGQEIAITLNPDGSFAVDDHGRGVPVDREPKTGLSGVEVVFTKLHAGGKFGNGNYGAAGGLHGVGASVVNALSARLDVEVDRNGKTYAMSFRRGEPGIFDDRGGAARPDAPFQPFTDASDLRVVAKVRRAETGTRVRYWPDPAIFTADARVEYADIADRARQTAFLVPGLRVSITDLRAENPVHEAFHFEGGIAEYAEYLAPDRAVTDVWRFTGEQSFTEEVPVLAEDGSMQDTEVERDCAVDVALRWGEGYDTVVRSYVNIIATPKGGTHVTGFEQAMLKVVRQVVSENSRKLKVGNDKLEKDDILAGLTAVISVRVPEPQFEGQTKEVLGTPAVRSIVASVVSSGLREQLQSPRRGQKIEVSRVLEKIVTEMKSRISARAHKETQRRKNALESSALPAKLVDCRSNDVAQSELFIVEGDSALGTAKLARDSEYQALLPIRGKILNVQKASVAEMLANAECANIIQVIGAGSGRTFDLSAARYGKVILMSDADVDGAHIRTLLLTLFFRYMRPMVEAGRVYAAVPPLHRVIVKNPGAKPNDVTYTYSEEQLHALVARLRKQGKSYVDPIQRYKGLGEMDADQLAETTMDKHHRLLRRVRLSDVQAAEAVFDRLMGSEVAPRRAFIMTASADVSRDRIDA